MTDAKAPPMTKLSELVNRLRVGVTWSDGKPIRATVGEANDPVMREAADAIERLERENAELREAFQKIINFTDSEMLDGDAAREVARASLSPSVEKGEG